MREKIIEKAKAHMAAVYGSPELQAMYNEYNANIPDAKTRWGTRSTKMIMSPTWGWCILFCCVAAIEAGLQEIVPQEIGPWEWYKIAQNAGLWKPKNYEPKPADFILYDLKGKGSPTHGAIVEYVKDGIIHTIEGNVSGGKCEYRTVKLNDSTIFGFIAPNYIEKSEPEPKKSNEEICINIQKIIDALTAIKSNL